MFLSNTGYSTVLIVRWSTGGFGNGVRSSHQFAKSNNMLLRTSAVNEGQALQAIEYQHNDAFLNISSRTNVVKNVTEDFTYDDLQRLSSATRHGITTSYEYDSIGNLLLKSYFANEYQYGNAQRDNGNAGPHAVYNYTDLVGIEHSLNYDNNGNLISAFGRTMSFNAFNKPISIVGGVASEFNYTPDLRLYKKN